jgi:hypothetical protein
MANTVYAVPADLTAWLLGSSIAPPTDAQRQLNRAAQLLDAYLVGVTYNVDVNGNPTDAVTIQAFNDACCAQVEWWLETGDEFADTALMNQYSIEGATVQFKTPPPRLAPRALDALRVAGLVPSQTPIHMP